MRTSAPRMPSAARRAPAAVPPAPDLACGVRVLWVARFDYTPDRRVAVHRHRTHHQLFHVLEGTAEFEIAGAATVAVSGDCLLLPPGRSHGLRVLGRRSLRTLDVKFRLQNRSLLAWLSGLPCPWHDHRLEVRRLLARLRSEAEAPDPGRQARCDALMVQALLELGRPAAGGGAGAAAQLQRSGDALPDSLLAWLEQHHREPVDAAAMARACGYSYRHVAGACRRAFDCTPAELLQRVRVAAVQRLLLHDQRDCGRLLMASGFASAAHGGRIFRRIAGHTPAAWRARERDRVGRGSVLGDGFADDDWVRPA